MIAPELSVSDQDIIRQLLLCYSILSRRVMALEEEVESHEAALASITMSASK
jgi:hypothetical protein